LTLLYTHARTHAHTLYTQVAREQKRAIGKEKRNLDRDLVQLDQQERKLTAEIKKLSAKGDMASGK
jgi:cell division protein FtsB